MITAWRRLVAALRRSPRLNREIALVLLVKTLLLGLLSNVWSPGPAPRRRCQPRNTCWADRPLLPLLILPRGTPMGAELDVVNLSRLQFGATAMYHFLFVLLTRSARLTARFNAVIAGIVIAALALWTLLSDKDYSGWWRDRMAH